MIINVRGNSLVPRESLQVLRRMILDYLAYYQVPAVKGQDYQHLIDDDAEEFARFAAWQLAHNQLTITHWQIGPTLASGFDIAEDKYWTAYMLSA